MRQIWITKSGDPRVLKVKESPTPTPKNGEVRIKVEAAGVNPADILARQGRLKATPPTPFVPGLEVAGTVDAIAQGITGVKEGDKVLAYTGFGGYSDTICVPYFQVFKRLDWMSAADGAALLVDYLTAYTALIVLGSLRPRNRVFIHDVNDCLGIAALNICRISDAVTYGTALTKYHSFLKEFGLIHPIDWREEDYEAVVAQESAERGLDIVLARYGESDWRKSYRMLGPAGKLIYLKTTSLSQRPHSLYNRLRIKLTKPTYSPSRLIDDNKSVAGFNLGNIWNHGGNVRRWMDQIISWYDEALFRPLIDKKFTFSEAQKAHDYVEGGQNKGKVLLIPD